MNAHRTKIEGRAWSFRREITLGALLQVITLLLALIIGWTNLQKELALLRREISVLARTSEQLREQLDRLNGQCQEHEFRLKALEGKTGHRQGSPYDNNGVKQDKTIIDKEQTDVQTNCHRSEWMGDHTGHVDRGL